MNIDLFIRPDSSGYHAFCPDLTCHMGGDTPEESLINLANAIIANVESLKKHNEKLIEVVQKNKLKRAKIRSAIFELCVEDATQKILEEFHKTKDSVNDSTALSS